MTDAPRTEAKVSGLLLACDEVVTSQQAEARAAVRQAVLGDEAPGGLAGSAFSRPLAEWAEAAVWDVWARPGLPLATRCIVTVTTLALQNRPGLLAVHIRAALRNGVTADQLGEIFTHLAVYGGVPVAADAMGVLKQVVDAKAVGTAQSEGKQDAGR